jgi:hypothetical protein
LSFYQLHLGLHFKVFFFFFFHYFSFRVVDKVWISQLAIDTFQLFQQFIQLLR